ncbi:hypothetical protein DFJ73DRAFT_124521 [Zopfochytrium polystomum]|nr:hypothetical protein DFJ73DRAFT_124521 [Zopfochytrium polystomum]
MGSIVSSLGQSPSSPSSSFTPSTADGPPHPPARLNPVFRLLLLGIHASKSSPLCVLRRDFVAVTLIFEAIEALWDAHIDWAATGVAESLFEFEFPPPLVRRKVVDGNVEEHYASGVNFGYDSEPYGSLKRPRTTSRPPIDNDDYVPVHINMMPIVMGQNESLPPICARYSDIINACLLHCPSEHGKIGYLTIHEDHVPVGRSQRRPGIHCESPGIVLVPESACEGGSVRPLEARWGRGYHYEGYTVKGGVFMASSVEGSCRVWDCVVRDHHEVVADRLGDLEHLRGVLTRPRRRLSLRRGSDPTEAMAQRHARRKRAQRAVGDGDGDGGSRKREGQMQDPRRGTLLGANWMAWMTDRTPHESVPVEVPGTFRQYFRLVTSQVSVWYERHSTKNELEIEPPEDVVIIKDDKFAAGDAESSCDESGWGTRPFPSSDYLTQRAGDVENIQFFGQSLWKLFTQMNVFQPGGNLSISRISIEESVELQSALLAWSDNLPKKLQIQPDEAEVRKRIQTLPGRLWCGQSILFVLFNGILCCQSLPFVVNCVSTASLVAAIEPAEAVCVFLAVLHRAVLPPATTSDQNPKAALSKRAQRRQQSRLSHSAGSGAAGDVKLDEAEKLLHAVWSSSSSACLWLLIIEAAIVVFVTALTAKNIASSARQGRRAYKDEARDLLADVVTFLTTFVDSEDGIRLSSSVQGLIDCVDKRNPKSETQAPAAVVAAVNTAVAVARGNDSAEVWKLYFPEVSMLRALEHSMRVIPEAALKIGIDQVFRSAILPS